MKSLTKPYLIQRMSFKDHLPEKYSFDDLLSLDYMGSAEFEFGALPKSLREMRDNISEYSIFKIHNVLNIKTGFYLFLICKDSQKEQYMKYIESMANGSWRGKEALKLTPHITGKAYGEKARDYDLNCDAWWDIDNHVIFTFGKCNAEKIVKAIGRTVFSSEKC